MAKTINLYNLFIFNSNMPTQDTSKIKNKIINIIRMRGPCLPVHIAKEIGMSILFTSAFLSELLSEKRIRISQMKVGSSSVHYLSGQEIRLENFSQHLKSRERDAYELLKSKKFLKDSEQEPAIRVALRAIKDFAIPFNRNNEIIWRYLTIPETELKEKIKLIKETKEPEKKVDIFDEQEQEPIKKEEPKKIRKKEKKDKKRKSSQKKNEKFFNTVKEFLSNQSIEIMDIIGFNKNELTLKVGVNNQEKLLIAYNKKRINEKDIIKASQKSLELNLKYILLSFGEPLKKLINLIKAIQNLSDIKKIE